MKASVNNLPIQREEEQICLVPNRELNLYILSMYYAFIIFQCIFSENNSKSRQFYSYMGIEEKIDIIKVYNYNIFEKHF